MERGDKGMPNFQNNKTGAFSNKHTIKVLSVTHLIVPMYLCSSGSNLHVKDEGPRRATSQLKKPFKDPKLRL